MEIKSIFTFLFSLCILEMVQLTPVPYKKLSKAELNQIALKCLDEVNLEKSVVEKVLKTEVLPRDNKKYNSYLACSYKKQGFLSPDGTKMIYSNIFEFLQDSYYVSELETLNHCKQIKVEDAGELCFQNLECILNGLRKVKAEEGYKPKNVIESNTI